MSNIEKTESLNCLMGIDFELFKTNINGVFSKSDNGFRILVAPTACDNAKGISFGEMITEMKNALGSGGDTKQIESSLEGLSNSSGGGAFDVNKLRFELRQTFLYIENEKTTEGGEAKTNAEFALSIYVDFSDALKSLGFLKLNSVFLSVWNTKRVTVLERMNMGEFEKLLPA